MGIAPSKKMILHVKWVQASNWKTGAVGELRWENIAQCCGAEIANSQERESESDRAKQKMWGKREKVRSQVFYRNERKAAGLFFLCLCFLPCSLSLENFVHRESARLVSLFQAV
jgi:hypothetical protein